MSYKWVHFIKKNYLYAFTERTFNGETGICVFLGMSSESFLESPDQEVKITNHQFGQDHTKPNFTHPPVFLQKSPKENVKSIFSDVLNTNRVLQSTSFSQSVSSIPFYT